MLLTQSSFWSLVACSWLQVVRGGDQVIVGGELECSFAECSGYKLEFSGAFAWRCLEESACEGTTFVVDSGSSLSSALDCGAFDKACYLAQMKVRSDLSGHFLDCGDAQVNAACDSVNLTLLDARIEVLCEAHNCEHFEAHLYGASQLTLHTSTTLPTSNQFQVYLHSPDAVFVDNAKSPYILHTSYVTKCDSGLNNEGCSGSTIVFNAGSQIGWHCYEDQCINTHFIVESGSTFGDDEMECDWGANCCYGASVDIYNSDLTQQGKKELDCWDSMGTYNGGCCEHLTLRLFDSKAFLWCAWDNCEYFRAFLYGNSELIIWDDSDSTLPNVNQLEVFLAPNAVFTDNGKSPYILHYIGEYTTTTEEPSTTETPTSTTETPTTTTETPTTTTEKPTSTTETPTSTTETPTTTDTPTTTEEPTTTVKPTTSRIPTTTEEPTTEEPTTEEPTTEEPITEEPITEVPTVEMFSTDTSTTKDEDSDKKKRKKGGLQIPTLLLFVIVGCGCGVLCALAVIGVVLCRDRAKGSQTEETVGSQPSDFLHATDFELNATGEDRSGAEPAVVSSADVGWENVMVQMQTKMQRSRTGTESLVRKQPEGIPLTVVGSADDGATDGRLRLPKIPTVPTRKGDTVREIEANDSWETWGGGDGVVGDQTGDSHEAWAGFYGGGTQSAQRGEVATDYKVTAYSTPQRKGKERFRLKLGKTGRGFKTADAPQTVGRLEFVAVTSASPPPLPPPLPRPPTAGKAVRGSQMVDLGKIGGHSTVGDGVADKDLEDEMLYFAGSEWPKAEALSDDQIYEMYVAAKGCAPKEARHLVAFSKTKCSSPIGYTAAKRLIVAKALGFTPATRK